MYSLYGHPRMTMDMQAAFWGTYQQWQPAPHLLTELLRPESNFINNICHRHRYETKL